MSRWPDTGHRTPGRSIAGLPIRLFSTFRGGCPDLPAAAQNGCGPVSPFSSSSAGGSTAGQVPLITQGWASMMARTGL